MKLRSLHCLLLQAVSLVSAISPGRVVLFDHSAASQVLSSSPDSVSPSTSKLIFAQRLGLSDDYSLEDTRSADIDLINKYGGPQQHPLAGAQSDELRAFIIVDGVKDIDQVLPKDMPRTSFDIDLAPHPEDTQELFHDFVGASSERQPRGDYGFANVKQLLDFTQGSLNSFKVHGDKLLIRVSSLASIASSSGEQSVAYREEAMKVNHIISRLYQNEDSISLTVAFMPSAQHCGRRVGASRAYSGLRKRSAQNKKSEVPMSGGVAKSEHISSHVNNPVLNPFAAGPFASRYASQVACERQTSNCTGHGECKVVATETNDDGKKQFFGCVCEPQVRDVGKGSKKTTYFGGAACQKKDVSVPFWLLAGTSVFLVSVVTMGIGLLYSMGADELPSVIGAGVSGPRAK